MEAGGVWPLKFLFKKKQLLQDKIEGKKTHQRSCIVYKRSRKTRNSSLNNPKRLKAHKWLGSITAASTYLTSLYNSRLPWWIQNNNNNKNTCTNSIGHSPLPHFWTFDWLKGQTNLYFNICFLLLLFLFFLPYVGGSIINPLYFFVGCGLCQSPMWAVHFTFLYLKLYTSDYTQLYTTHYTN